MIFKIILFLLVGDYFLFSEAQETYDFIVVGGGTAGSVLAARLSETFKVLLVEAGKENNIPKQTETSVEYQGTDLDWNYEIEPQKNSCLGLENKKLFWHAGKTLGGTSELNYMIYTRGNKKDYDRWAEKGNPGWSYKEVLPYFMKSENYRFDKFNRKYHNDSGQMHIKHFYTSKLTDIFLKAAQQLGYPLGDYNGREQIRFSKVKAYMRKRRRYAVFRAFLKAIKDNRENLVVVTSAQVTKVIIEHNRAEGVEYVKNGKTDKAYARKEVILSAGVVGTTKLLLLSGIGPKEDLAKLQIPLVKNLPVGQGIKDHIAYFGLNYLINFQPNYNRSCSGSNGCKGLSPDGVEAVGFINTKNDEGANVPDVEVLLVNNIINKALKKLTNMAENTYRKLFQPVEQYIALNMFPILLHPQSKGFIKLRSKNYSEPPIIEPNYLSEPADLNKIVAGIKFVNRLANTLAFRQINAELYPVPVCEEFARNSQPYSESEEYWRCAVETLTVSFNDYMGGCKMGPSTDPEAVVDDRLQVHGVSRLMVVDASVIPVTISGHVGAVAIMVAEKAVDIIKEKHESKASDMILDMLYDVRDTLKSIVGLVI